MINPNVGAVLALDHAGEGAVTNEMLRSYAEEHDYPIWDVPHEFMSLRGGFRSDLEKAKSVVADFLDRVNEAERTEEPASELKIGLQCGGSDAFSGVSANPLVGWVTKEVVRNGGISNLAETDELIGAEHYVLKNVKDGATAGAFWIPSSGSRNAWAGTGTRPRTILRAATTSAASTTSR